MRSRGFWAALAGLAVTMARGLSPGFPLNEEQMTTLFILLASFILAEGIEGQPGGAPFGCASERGLRARLADGVRSRKLWAALLGAALVLIQAAAPYLPFTPDDLNRQAYLVAVYILGVGVADARRGWHGTG
ncbi:MAG: hypothetical protein U1B80_02215 [Anaerolineaceae bacterium]|nr:hypothetical protein [Anaerolineaceae bacterium]